MYLIHHISNSFLLIFSENLSTSKAATKALEHSEKAAKNDKPSTSTSPPPDTVSVAPRISLRKYQSTAKIKSLNDELIKIRVYQKKS